MSAIGWLRETFEISRGGASGNVRSMEGMRGLAVTAVFFVHYATLSFPFAAATGIAPILSALHLMGSVGVDLFFVLSGYLIYAAALKRPAYVQFMRRRIRRIYPTFLTVFLVYLALSVASPHESKIPHGVGPALLLIAQNVLLLPGIFPIERIINVAWSLSYEMLYYLVIPLLVVGLDLTRWRPRHRIALFLALGVIGILVSGVVGGPVGAVMFFGGAFLYELRDKPVRLPFVAPMALTVAFASMLITTGIHRVDDAIHVAVMFVALPLFGFACFSDPSSRSTKLLSAWPIRWLGNMSYSYYLLHGLTLAVAFRALVHVHRATGHQVALVVALVVPFYLLTVATSAALFVMIERPFSLRESRPRMAAVLN